MKSMVLMVAMACLVACGKENPPPALQPVDEVCTVSFLPDGTVQCVCEVRS